MIYNTRLIKLREEKNLKQYEVAKILKIYKGLYNQYEKEYEIIPIKHLNTLCNYFNVSFDYIFGFTNISNYANSNNEVDSKKSGKRLKEFRKEQKITQTTLGKELNCSYGTIAGYEIGRYLIATPFLYTICKKYNISADYLLGKIDNPKYLKFKAKDINQQND